MVNVFFHSTNISQIALVLGAGESGLWLGLCPPEDYTVHFMLLWFKLCPVNKAFLEEVAAGRSLRGESVSPGWRLRRAWEEQGAGYSQRDQHGQRSGRVQ